MSESFAKFRQGAGAPLVTQAAKFMRFALVGASCSALYAIVTLLLTNFTSIPPGPASLLGYIAATPLSFFGQRSFAFRAGGEARAQFIRFVVTTLFNLALSYGIMELSTRWLDIGVVGGVCLTILAIPVVTFLVLDNWVFRPARSSPPA